MKKITWQKILKKLNNKKGRIYQLLFAKTVFEQKADWDILCILDGCRYDSFEQVNWLPGQLSARISHGSCTPDWAQAEIKGDQSDVVYISANPYVSEYFFSEEWGREQPFFHLEEVWDTGWSEELKTVLPETVINAAKKLIKKHPDKKFVLHFMQPHHPFIGKKRIDEKSGWQATRSEAKGELQPRFSENVYDLLKKNKITRHEAMEAYRDNIALVLAEIQDFVDGLPKGKKIVLGADHGNCFGEYGVFGHPEKFTLLELIKTPWFEVGR